MKTLLKKRLAMLLAASMCFSTVESSVVWTAYAAGDGEAEQIADETTEILDEETGLESLGILDLSETGMESDAVEDGMTITETVAGVSTLEKSETESEEAEKDIAKNENVEDTEGVEAVRESERSEETATELEEILADLKGGEEVTDSEDESVDAEDAGMEEEPEDAVVKSNTGDEADESEGEIINFNYKVIDGNNIAITGGPSVLPEKLVIPSTYKGYTVTEIDNYAFVGYEYEYDNVKEIVIADTVTKIGNGAFDECYNVTTVKLSKTLVTIGDYAFSECHNLNAIEFPFSLTSIGYRAFSGCESLGEVIIPENITEIKDYTFCGCSSLKKIILPKNIVKIGRYSFCRCSGLEEIAIPDKVLSLESGCFEGCENLKKINIPDSLTEIGREAFYGCSKLSDISIPDSVKNIYPYAFGGCTSLTEVNIPDSGIQIYSNVFRDCTGLTSVVIPDSVNAIEANTFAGCTNLKKVTIGKNVTRIEYNAFSRTENLPKLTLPKKIQKLGRKVFQDSGISNVKFKGDAPSIEEDTFENVKATVNYPKKNATWTSDVMRNYGGILSWRTDDSADEDTNEEKHEHNYGEPKFTWSNGVKKCVAEFTCSDCGQTAEKSCKIEETIAGYKYTAKVTLGNQTYKKSKTVKTIVALDENGNPTLKVPVYVIGSGDILRLECSIPLKYFVEVKVDDVPVDPSQYTLEEGSTIVTFSNAFLDTLTPGTHTVTMNYEINGKRIEVPTKVIIKEKKNHAPKPDTNNTTGQGNSGNSGTQTQTHTVNRNTVPMVTYMIDVNDQPLASYTLEIHSDPVSAQLNKDGLASFRSIEAGNHTMYLKNNGGSIVAKKDIKIAFSNRYSIDGNVINILSGRSFKLNVKYDGEKLILLSVEGAAPQTGDDTNPMLWFVWMIMAAFCMEELYRRKSA